MRARKLNDPGYQAATVDITNQLRAVAETLNFMHASNSLDSVNITAVLEGLCAHLEQAYGTKVAFEGAAPLLVAGEHATSLTVIVNELVTNAIKHGNGGITLSCRESDDTLRIAVANGGSVLPKGFAISQSKGFGLRAVNAMIDAMNGKITAENIPAGGVLFEVAVPMSSLRTHG